MGRLGCLDSIEAIVTGQCATNRICALTNITSVSWNRILDEISEAVVEIPIATGIGQNPCCECLGDIEPWCHELAILRNGEIVWQGPIIKITYGFEKVVIEARDVLAWLTVRIPQGVLDNSLTTTSVAAASNGVDITTFKGASTDVLFVGDTSKFATPGLDTTGKILPITFTVNLNGTATPADNRAFTYQGISGNSLTGVKLTAGTGTLQVGDQITAPSNGTEITDLAVDLFEGAFSEHDPCVLDFIMQTDVDCRPTLFANTVVSPETGFPAFEGSYFEWLEALSGIGLDYTVIGRRVLLGVGVGDFCGLPKLGTLTEDHIMGEIQVAKDGFNMGNRFFVRYQDDDDAAQCAANNPEIPAPPCPALSESDDIDSVCYGPIERLNSEGVPFNYTTAKQAADGYVNAGRYAPRTVDMEQGTALSPDTPWQKGNISTR